MEAIRHIQSVENGEIHLRLPQRFWGQEVEIIVLPAPRAAESAIPAKRSLRGGLKTYANPGLMAQEDDAWALALGTKYEPR